jgi:Uma2 family endonuclease
MVAVLERPMHMVFPNVSWETFERLLDEVGESRFRFAYRRGRLEFMTTSFKHDHVSRWLGRLIFFVALELKIPLATGGSTTLKESLLKVGLEPDECFWIKHEKAMRDKEKWDAAQDPPPDLAVEIDITSSWLDRLGIYAELQVPEVWRYDGEKLKILVLVHGKYKERTKSLAFPTLPMDGFAQFVAKLGSADEVSLIQEFTDWLRGNVPAKKTSAERKNGRK